MMPSWAKIRRRLMRVRRLGLKDVRILLIALIDIIRIRIFLSIHKTQRIRTRIAHDLGIAQKKNKPSPENHRTACAEVVWSVAAMARFVPKATCLTQAFSAQSLLAQRGILCVVHLTVPKDSVAGFRPHAWVLIDGKILLGGTAQEYMQHTWLVDYLADGRVKPASQENQAQRTSL